MVIFQKTQYEGGGGEAVLRPFNSLVSNLANSEGKEMQINDCMNSGDYFLILISQAIAIPYYRR